MAPAVRAAEWVDVRPLRRTRAPTPGKPANPPPHSKPQPGGLSSLAIIGRRLPASSSFVLARALTGANGCGRSSLTRGRAAARKLAAARKPSTTANPGAITRSPGQDSTLTLTAKAPIGG
jgi:hypothetical protein